MSLTRYLPLPSDRMGAIWNLLGIEDSIVLEYGPAGTTHFSMSLYGELGVDRENSIFTTHMSEDDVVMGDVTRLEEAIVEIDRSYAPKVIFVVGSSIAAVIGTDVKGVCTYMQDKVSARLIAFDQGGFRGDYTVGNEAVWSLLTRELVKPCTGKEKDSATYNLLGVSAGSYRMCSDVWEIENLLREGFGLKANVKMCMDTSVDAIENAGTAGLNIVLREEAIGAAKWMEENCGVPYVFGTPYGYSGTLAWLESVGRAIGREPAPSLIARLRKKMEDASMYRMYGMMLKKDRPSAVLVGEYHVIAGLSDFLSGIGLPVSEKICLHTMKGITSPDKTICHFETEKERIDLLSGIHRAFVLGDDISMRMCPNDNIFYRISSPVIHGSQSATHLPIAGEKGTDALIEKIDEYFQMVH